MYTSRWLNNATFVLAAVLVVGCGRVKRDSSAPEAAGGGAAQASVPDGMGGSSLGVGGTVAVGGSFARDPTDASDPVTLPYPFDRASCPGTLPADGVVHCVTRAELAKVGSPPRLLVDGGIEGLGTESSWRCPELTEIDFSRHCECCNEDALCGPVVALAPFDAGSPVDAAAGEQLCCYFTVTLCLV